jgi:hypothetical protein
MKEQVLQFIKDNSKKIILVLVGAALIYFAYLVIINKIDSSGQKKPVQPIVDSKYFLNLEPDTNRLSCVFEQRRCLFENLGLEKEGVITRCGSVSFCDEKFRIKK